MPQTAGMCWPTSITWSSVRRTRARRGRAAPSRASIPRAWDPPSATQLLQEIEIRGASLVAEAKIGFGTTPSLTPARPGAQAVCGAHVRGRDQQPASRCCRAVWP